MIMTIDTMRLSVNLFYWVAMCKKF